MILLIFHPLLLQSPSMFSFFFFRNAISFTNCYSGQLLLFYNSMRSHSMLLVWDSQNRTYTHQTLMESSTMRYSQLLLELCYRQLLLYDSVIRLNCKIQKCFIFKHFLFFFLEPISLIPVATILQEQSFCMYIHPTLNSYRHFFSQASEGDSSPSHNPIESV